VKKADEIIVMDRGELVEKGTHSELLSNKEGYYYELYSKQFSNGEEI
jgi:ATP-binding cassette subfamily B multidrug efflux pump